MSIIIPLLLLLLLLVTIITIIIGTITTIIIPTTAIITIYHYYYHYYYYEYITIIITIITIIRFVQCSMMLTSEFSLTFEFWRKAGTQMACFVLFCFVFWLATLSACVLASRHEHWCSHRHQI